MVGNLSCGAAGFDCGGKLLIASNFRNESLDEFFAAAGIHMAGVIKIS